MAKTEWFGKRYTYAELCELLGEERLSGSKQRTQIKRWNDLYMINKVGRYYDLVREWTEEEQQQMQIKGFYQGAIEVLLSEILGGKKGNYATYSTMELLIDLGIVSEDYKYVKYNQELAAEIMGKEQSDIMVFMGLSYPILSDLVKRVIKTLDNKLLVKYRNCYRTFNTIENRMCNIEDVEIGSKLESDILGIEETVLREFGLKTRNELYYNNGRNLGKFKDRCNDLFKAKFGKDGFYNVYHITLNKNGLRANAIRTRKELNSKVKGKLLNSKSLYSSFDERILLDLIEATIDENRPFKIKENVLPKESTYSRF